MIYVVKKGVKYRCPLY